MEGHVMDEEPVAHSSPKPEVERPSRNFARFCGNVTPSIVGDGGTTQQGLQSDPTAQLFPWISLPTFEMSDLQVPSLAENDMENVNNDNHASVSSPSAQNVIPPCSLTQAQSSSHFYSAALATVRPMGCLLAARGEASLESQQLSSAQQVVCEEEPRPPSLPAAVSDPMSPMSSVGPASVQGCDSAPSTPVSPDTTSLTPSASFDSLEAWAGQSQPHMKTYQTQSTTSESQTNDGSAGQTKPRPKKRSRMQYTEDQVDILESTFRRNRYPTRQERDILHQAVGLPPEKIKTWFQNRRSREKRNMMSKLQQQQQQQQQQQHFQQLGPVLQQSHPIKDMGKPIVPGAVGDPATSPGLQGPTLQHHSHSTILTAYPGGMVRFVPGQYPVGPTSIPHVAPVSFLPDSSTLPVRGATPETAGAQTPQKNIKPIEPSFGVRHAAQSGLLSYENTARAYYRGSQTYPAAVSPSEQPMNSPHCQRSSPTVSSPTATQHLYQTGQGVYRHASVSPTSVYNPGITYPFQYHTPSGCYPYWMNYSGGAPANVAFASGSPPDMSPGFHQQWSPNTSPSDGSRVVDAANPWSGQILAGCTTDWLQHPIMHYPTLPAQHAIPVPSATSVFASAPQEYSRKELRGMASAPYGVPVTVEIPGTNVTRAGACSASAATTSDTAKLISADGSTCMAGRSSDHLLALDFGNSERISPSNVSRDYNMSPYLCFSSSRDCTPTKSVGEGEKPSWFSPLNTPELQSLPASQTSSRAASPIAEGERQHAESLTRKELKPLDPENRENTTVVSKSVKDPEPSYDET